MNDQTTNWQMVDLKPMGELDAMRNRAETAEMDARLAGEEIERLITQLAAVTTERDALRAALVQVRDIAVDYCHNDITKQIKYDYNAALNRILAIIEGGAQ